MSLPRYFKEAFTNRWNMLVFFGGMAFAALSGRPDVVAPLVAAGELTYLTLLGTHPKFQAYVDAQQARSRRAGRADTSQEALERIVRALPKASHDRFQQLRQRCLELRRIALDLKGGGDDSPGDTLDELQVAGLDRLLWVYLRLLFSENALRQFLEKTDLEAIQREIRLVEERLGSIAGETDHAAKIRRTLQDNLETCRQRLANYEKARSNHEFIQLEVRRLENKIKSLAELAINRQEPDYISHQVDEVARSMIDTERTINELDFATGLGPVDDDVPELIRREVRVAE